MNKKQKMIFISIIIALFILVMGMNTYLTNYALSNQGDIATIRATYWSSIIGSFIAGILTLIGVILTILNYKKSDYEQNRLQHMPYMQVSFENYIVGDKSDSYFPNMLLSIGRVNDARCPSSGKSIVLTNIGLGMAVNLKCKWSAEGSHAEYNFPTSLLKKEDSALCTFIISAELPKKEPRTAEAKIVICFEDFLGNYYEQIVDLVFEIHQHHIALISYETNPPQFIDK